MEYRIICKGLGNQVANLRAIISLNALFARIVKFKEKELYEFRSVENSGSMPDFTVVLEKDAIYVNRHDCLPVWYGIEQVKLYFEKEKLAYKVTELD